MTQRASLSEGDQRRLSESQLNYMKAQTMVAAFRAVVVDMIDKSSYREVARLTGLSTNTLQRWKREAGK